MKTEKTDFIPLEYDYFDFEGKNYIKIIGRSSHGKRICIIDSCDVYLWIILKEGLEKDSIKMLTEKIKKIRLDVNGRQTKVENVEAHEKNFLGKHVKALKIFATNYKDLHDIADKLDFPEIEMRRGYDLGFVTNYIIEKKMIPLHWYEISGEVLDHSEAFGKIGMNLDVDTCIKLTEKKEIKDAGKEPNFQPKALAYDIETDEIKIGEGEILMVSLASNNFKKVITWKKPKKVSGKNMDHVEYVKNEAELLEKFVKHVREISPDFLVGYFSDGFDLPYLRARAEKLNVSLSLGLDESQPRFFRGGAGKGLGAAKISGIIHIDILKFIQTAYSQYMQSETLSLNEVAHEFLGDGKKKFKPTSSKTHDHDWDAYYEYNLHDSVLTLGLFEKMWPDLLEFSRVMQEPIFDVSRNGMSSNVEDYIIHNLERFNEIPEKKPIHDEISSRREMEKYEGAFVFEPIPGLYENIAVFDFTSSYGTTIVTYNLSKSTFLGNKKEKDSHSIVLEGKEVYFSKKSGFFPEMLKEIIEKRKKYKKELQQKPDVIKKARSNAFKLLANAAYGYQGFFGARYYCREAAAATAAFAKKMIKEVIEKINKASYKVIYSDTDSIAFLIEDKTESQTLEFLKKMNSQLPGIMELEIEGFFKRGLWVTKRTGTIGAKKKYALLGKDGKLKIRGFETVRRDWCPLARETQNKIIKLILEDGNEKKALEYLKDIIKKIKQRKIDKEELVIKTMLRKPLSEYKNVTPHVIAAKKMQEKELPITAGNLIEYYIAQPKDGEGKKLVRERVNLSDEKGEYDIDYYLNKQVLPAAENIFQVFGVDINEIIEGKKQMKIGDF